MDAYIAKNKSGWILHEYISIQEEQISEYPNVTGSYAIVKVGDQYLIGYNDWREVYIIISQNVDFPKHLMKYTR